MTMTDLDVRQQINSQTRVGELCYFNRLSLRRYTTREVLFLNNKGSHGFSQNYPETNLIFSLPYQYHP